MIDPASLKIVTAPHPALKTVALEVGEITPEIQAIADRMLYLLDRSRTGIGLAANQVGLLRRIVVVNVPGKKSDWKRDVQTATRGPVVMINPRFKVRSAEVVTDEEGCLSHPGVRVRVARAASISVVFRDRLDQKRILVAGGLLARCIQHEVDHLDGISIVDKPGAEQ